MLSWIDTDGDNIRDKVIDGVKTQFKFKLSYMSSPITTEIVLMIKGKYVQKLRSCTANSYGLHFIL